ncbi:MAG: nuclease [Synechococcaceae bacterium WBA_2_066]|nr:nuclease [Synechococcaceae bacterium WB6_1A_059]NBP31696.1 nuclease [Synechococcaceae bacterium WB6_1B_055]NBP98604.1 nuclease [Synechococcaceae bacterium WB6_3A_227]NBQ18092.1 nuclease [Synechococcaceae bacterium WB5_2A_257]NBR43736.1 nuclease [Synechococcaceae bacterium WB5_2B_268]NBY59500.1 nuclease [Synechococcaceae bacterium LLD_019]NCU91090.1 nuclease [Synechococcaceae bacterium WB7_1B_046]NCY13488.1 nuclease [Synechococcaceae bacterium WB8_1A_041]NDA74657.1 nuclease [Synechococcac
MRSIFGYCLALLLLISGLLLAPVKLSAAEVLQVREADLLLIGDQNRTYSVRLACADIIQGQEQNSIAFLRKQLPRRQKVNLMPMGSKDGLLLARVRPLGSSQDLSGLLVENELAKLNQSCIKATKPLEKA